MVANSRFTAWVMVVSMVLVLAAVSFTLALAQEATPPATQEPQATGTEQPAAGEAMPGADAGGAGQVGEALPTLGAGGEEAPVELPPQGYLIETFQKGGVFMWPLLICSVIGLAVILERAWTFRRAQVNTRQFMSKVVGALKEDGVPGGIEVCLRTRGPIAAILHAGLSRATKGPEEVEKAIENAGAIEMSFLQRGLIILVSVVNVAPMLGFLGTVSGMIHAFEAIAASRHRIVAAYTQPDRPSGRGLKLESSPVKRAALARGIPVEQPVTLKDPAAVERLASWRADVMVVVAYGLLLPQAVLDVPRLGCLNIHASLLPRWRGAAPIQRALLAGDRETGITIMRLEAGLDTGPMLSRQALPIAPDETGGSLHDRLASLGAEHSRLWRPGRLHSAHCLMGRNEEAKWQRQRCLLRSPEIRWPGWRPVWEGSWFPFLYRF